MFLGMARPKTHRNDEPVLFDLQAGFSAFVCGVIELDGPRAPSLHWFIPSSLAGCFLQRTFRLWWLRCRFHPRIQKG